MYRLVVISAGGLTGYYGPAARIESSSYRDIPEFLGALDSGGVAIDIRDAVERDISIAFRSPYVDPFRPDGYIGTSHGLSREALVPLARAAWGAASVPMLDTSDGRPFTGFDTVSLDHYVAFWSDNGARIGRKTSAGFTWESDAPNCACT